MRGVKQTEEIGNIKMNPATIFDSQTSVFLHLHISQDGQSMSISPNNGAFLLNLGMPIVNFFFVMYFKDSSGNDKLNVSNVTIVNNSQHFLVKELSATFDPV